MRNRWSLFVLVTITSMILAACGGGGGNTGSTNTNTNSAPAAENPTVAPAAEVPTAMEAPTAASATDNANANMNDNANANASMNDNANANMNDNANAGAATAEPAATAEGTASGGTGGIDALKGKAAQVGPELADAFNGKYKGTKVTMMGPFVDADQVKFEQAIKQFEDATGIDIQYEGTKEFETLIGVRVDGGTPPDIADFPQPGLMATFAKQGKVQDVTGWFADGWLKKNYNQGYIDTATVPGQSGNVLGGVFQRINVKGLVFYPKKPWDDAGYKVPKTWDDLNKLMDNIVADGDAPWCIGIESGTATGWPATDWMEQMMLRTTSLENYDKWTKGELPFTSPEVKNAADEMAKIWFNPKYVYGGTQNIVSTNFGDAPTPMFQSPPKCWMVNQGNFITSFFPKEAKPGVDYDVFYLPPINDQYGAPVEFGGDLMSAFTDRPEVKAVEQFFSTFASVDGWVRSGGALSPHNDADLSAYTNDIDRKIAQILVDAKAVRFDGSDLMPGAVGAGTFWKGMTDWVSGAAKQDQALQEAQSGWKNVQK